MKKMPKNVNLIQGYDLISEFNKLRKYEKLTLLDILINILTYTKRPTNRVQADTRRGISALSDDALNWLVLNIIRGLAGYDIKLPQKDWLSTTERIQDKRPRCPMCRSVLVEYTDVNREIMLICPKYREGCSRQIHPMSGPVKG